MSEAAAIVTACLVLALGCTIGALRCLADHLLASAWLYMVAAVALIGGAARAAMHSL
jgi:hypothetical protein